VDDEHVAAAPPAGTTDPADAPERPRRTLRLLFLLTAMMSLGYGSVFTLLADIRDRFGFTDADVGLIAFAGFATGFTCQVALARYADRGHTALMLRAGVAVAALGMVGAVVAEELWAWVGARLLLGVGSGTVGPAVRRLVITRDPGRVGANLGTQAAFDVAGFVLGPILAAVLAELVGLRAPFVALAALYGLGFVVLLRLDLSAGEAAVEHRGVRRLLALPAVQSALCAAIAFYLTIGMFEALWSILLSDLGAETWLIGLTLSLFTLPMVVFAPRGGAMAQARGPLRVVTVSILVAAACTAVYGIAPLWVVIAASGVHAVADAFTMPGNQVAVAVASPPDQIASGQGLLGATGLAVAGLAALVGAGLYDVFGRATVFTATGVTMVLFLALARWRWAVGSRPATGRAAVAST
jgi:DHA1 family multidrug resistance protein-like MFS transporter